MITVITGVHAAPSPATLSLLAAFVPFAALALFVAARLKGRK